MLFSIVLLASPLLPLGLEAGSGTDGRIVDTMGTVEKTAIAMQSTLFRLGSGARGFAFLRASSVLTSAMSSSMSNVNANYLDYIARTV